jgi:hypothetical protein
MKLTRYFFVVAVSTALATGLTGCLSQDEFLEEHSYKFDDQTFYQSESDMELALNGCYRQIQSLMMGQTHGAHSWMIGGIGLDTYSQKGGNDHFSNWNTLTSESGYTRHWYDNLFKLINRANTVIDMIDERVNIQYSSEEKKLAIRAEAVFFRGWAYRVLAGMAMCLFWNTMRQKLLRDIHQVIVKLYGNSVRRILNMLQLICQRQPLNRASLHELPLIIIWRKLV